MEVYLVKISGKDVSSAIASQASALQGSSKKSGQESPRITFRQEQIKKSSAVHNTSFPKMLEIAQQVGEKLKSSGVSIQFEINKDAGRVIIKVLDPVSGKVVRKIPPEAYMKSVQYLNEMKNKLRLNGIEVDVCY